jgi:hypothetical protein
VFEVLMDCGALHAPLLAGADHDARPASRWAASTVAQHVTSRLASEVLLDRQALLNRLASEGMPSGGSMSLFRVEDDGATTVLARYPLVAQEQGRTLRGHVAAALLSSPNGVIQVVSQIDNVERIVGYQRLTDGGERLAVVYALPVSGVLSAWTAQLPLADRVHPAGGGGHGLRRLAPGPRGSSVAPQRAAFPDPERSPARCRGALRPLRTGVVCQSRS